MEISKVDHHCFNLDGLEEGDMFLGCPRCQIQLPPGVAGRPVCEFCQERLILYTVTKEDLCQRQDK